MEIPEGSGGQPSPMDISGSPIVMGDLHQHFHQTQPGHITPEPSQEVVENAKRELRNIAEENVSIVPTLESADPVDPVELQLTENVQLLPNQQAEVQRKIQLLEQTNPLVGDVSIANMFEKANQKAESEANSKFRDEKKKKDYIARHGKVVGVTGVQGVGKTTLTKMVLRLILNGVIIPAVTFIFLLSIREINFEEKCTVFDLLFYKSPAVQLYNDDEKEVILKQILADRNTVIFIDGMDELDPQLLSKHYKVSHIKSKADPISFIMNMLGGQLLPNAYKLATSRPRAMLEISVEHRPHFLVEILGLNETAQKQLGLQICGTEFLRVQKSLQENPELLEHCLVPFNCIALFTYLLQNNPVQTTTISDIIVSILLQYLHSSHMQNRQVAMQKLAKLAWIAFDKHKFIFSEEDLIEVGLSQHDIKTFLTTTLDSRQKLHSFILQQDKKSFFSHQIWQDMFIALHMLFHMPLNEFNEKLPKLNGEKGANVKKFVYGICNPFISTKAKQLFLAKPHFHGKLQAIEVFTTQSVQLMKQKSQSGHIVLNHSSNLATFHCLKELNCPSITTIFASKLTTQYILNGYIFPSDVSSIFYVTKSIPQNITFLKVEAQFVGESFTLFCAHLKASKSKVVQLTFQQKKVPDLPKFRVAIPCIEQIYFITIDGNVLHILCDALEETNHVMNLLSFDHLQLKDGGLAYLCTCINKIKSLSLRGCCITERGINMLCQALAQPNQLVSLDLSFNSVGNEAANLLRLCPNLNRIVLSFCGINWEGAQALSNNMKQLKQKGFVLVLFGNQIKSRGVEILSECLSMVNELVIDSCEVQTVTKLAKSIKNLDKNQKLMICIGNNPIGNAGLDKLSTCFNNIDKLSVNACGITDVFCLPRSILKLGHQISELNVSQNLIGSFGAEVLSKCIGHVKRLLLMECGIADDGAEKLAGAVQKLENPIESLDLTRNQIKDEGAKFFVCCFKNVEDLSLAENPITLQCGSDMMKELVKQNLPAERLSLPYSMIEVSQDTFRIHTAQMIPGQFVRVSMSYELQGIREDS